MNQKQVGSVGAMRRLGRRGLGAGWHRSPSTTQTRSLELLESRELLTVETSLLAPLGSLIQRTTSTDTIGAAAEVDQLSFQLDAGQKVSVAIRPSATLRPQIELLNSANVVVGTAAASANGAAALFQSVATVLGGSYTLKISGVGNTLGSYVADVYLNSAVESETFTGVTNNNSTSAQDLGGNFIELAGGLAQRAAVVGHRDPDLLESFETPLAANEWTTFSSDPNGLILVSPDFGKADGTAALVMGRSSNGPQTLNQATWKVDLSGVTAAQLKFSHADFLDEETNLPVSFTGNANGDGVSISTNGTNWFRVLPAKNLVNGVWQAESINLVAAASTAGIALDSDFFIRFQQYDDGGFSGDGRAYDAVRIETVPVKPVVDWYKLDLSDGDFLSLNLAAIGATAGFFGSLSVYDAGLNLLATSSTTDELMQVISNFRDGTTNLTADTYFIVVNDPPPDYSLVVMRDADFDREQNDAFVSPQVLEGGLQSLGYASNEATGSLQIKQNFSGPSYTGFIPPDPSAAAGPNQLVTVVNTHLAIYDKATGAVQFEQNMSGSAGFFGQVGAVESVFDPWVIYDTTSDRFFVVGIEIEDADSSNVYLAVSTTSTPTNGTQWHKYRFEFAHDPQALGFGLGAHFPDYEKIATTDDALFVSANYFPIVNGTGNYAGITAFNKAPLLAGLPPTKLYEEFFPGSTVFPLQHVEASSTTQYFAEQRGTTTIRIHAVTNVLSAPQRSTFDLSVPAYSEPVLVPQPGGVTPLQSIDSRIMTGVWRDGSAWFAHAVADPAIGDGENVARWYQVATNNFPAGTPTLQQSGNVDPGPGIHAWMPAIAVDGGGNMAVGFSIGGATLAAGAGFSGRTPATPLGQTLGVTTYANGGGSYELVDGSGRNRWGDYSGMSVDPSDDRTFWVFNEYATFTPTVSRWGTRIASFEVSPLPEGDFYAFNANAGDLLSIETFTPFAAVGQLENALDPAIRLYAPDGTLLNTNDNGAVDGRNAKLVNAAATTGTYRVEVLSAADKGDYFLSIQGVSAPGNGPTVIDSTPDDGQLLNAFPTTYSVTFSEHLSVPSVQATDLFVNGQPSTAVVVQGNKATFTVNPVVNVGQGVYSVTLGAATVTDLQGLPNVLGFAGSFVVDLVGPRIVSTTWNGSLLPADVTLSPGPLEFVADLSEDIFVLASARRGPLSPSSDDAILVNRDTDEIISEDAISYSRATDRFVAQYDDLSEGNYRLTLVSGAGAFEDDAGNDMDGEPLGINPDGTITGNGTPGGNYQVDFAIDIDDVDLQDFVRLEPFGGLIAASRQNQGFINSGSDEDRFHFFGQAGQSVSGIVRVDSSAVTSVNILDATNAVVLTAIASSPGGEVVIPTSTLSLDGNYQIVISGTDTANYDFNIYLNAIAEEIVGDTGLADELAIDSSYLGPIANRWAVVGRTEDAFTFIKSNDASKFVDISSSGLALDLLDDEEVLLSTTVGNELIPSGEVTVGNNGAILVSQGANLYFQNLPLPAPNLGRALFPYWDDLSDGSGNVYIDEVQVAGVDTLIVQWQDRSHFDAGGAITFQAQVFETGATLARFVYLDTEFGDARYDHGASATVGYQFSDDDGIEYIFGGAEFTPPIAPTNNVMAGDVLDLVRTADIDEYTLDLSLQVGSSLDIVLAGIDGVDFSSADLELLDPNGNVVATGTTQPLGVTVTNYDLAIANYLVPSIGNNVYTLRVSSASVGEYGLVVADGLVFDTEPNEVGAVIRTLSNERGALGYLSPTNINDSYHLQVNAGETVVIDATAPFGSQNANPANTLADSQLELRVIASNGITLLGLATISPGNPIAEISFGASSTETVTVEVRSLLQGEGEYILSARHFASDFGDAPNSFGTLGGSNGASHATIGPRLGALRDSELDGQPSFVAFGDDVNGLDDEDGVTLTAVAIGQFDAAWVVDVQNAAGGAFISAWVDFDGNGSWSPSEQIWNGVPVTNGSNTLEFDVPLTATAGLHFARYRISSSIVSSPFGFVGDGEVEDHPVNILDLLPFIPVPDSNTATDNGIAAVGNVLLNDVDPNGGNPTFVANPGSYIGNKGVLTVTSNGSYSYLVNDESIGVGFTATDVFSVDITDGFAVLSAALTITVNGSNDPPVFVSPSAISVDENSTIVVSVLAVDVDAGDSLAYSLGTNGTDTSLFVIDSVTGELSFVALPNFETPSDTNGDNIYQVEVTVSDGTTTVGQLINVTVLNIQEVALPRIVAVWVDSSVWTPQFRDAADGLPDDGSAVGYKIPGGKDQVKPLPWSNVDRILIQFSEDVGSSIDIGDFELTGISGLLPNGDSAVIPSISSVSFQAQSLIATLVLDRRISNSVIDISVLSAGIQDSVGNLLDGEWTNTVSIGPSGNGTPGGDFDFRLVVLPGDANQSGSVSISDLAQVAATFGGVVGGLTYSVNRDINGSGSISISDLAAVAALFGSVAPPSGNPLPAVPATTLASAVAESAVDELSDSDWEELLGVEL